MKRLPAQPSLFVAPSDICHFSPCRTWRYWLRRSWDAELEPLVVIGLNPSTADENYDDPTVRRCVNYARAWGHGGLVMLNIFAYRSTDPAGLTAPGVSPVGAENDQALIEQTMGRRVVCAWGVHGKLLDRGAEVLRLINPGAKEVLCLGVTKEGYPKHPLYLRADLKPIPYPPV